MQKRNQTKDFPWKEQKTKQLNQTKYLSGHRTRIVMTVATRILTPLALIALSAVPIAFSKDIGKIGETYSIHEQDMLGVIEKKLLTKRNDLFGFNQQYQKKINESVNNLKGTKLPSASQYRGIELIPSFTLKEDIKDASGKIIFQKGTTVNPLNIRHLTKMFCFFDGDNQEQIDWTLKHCGPKDKLVLTQGKYLELSKKLQRRIYFDQYGYLTQRLGITALPATLRQYGEKLYVEEHLVH